MAQTVILYGPSQREHAKRLIDKAPKDAVLTIREAKRTIPQNDLMWAKLSEISIAKPEGRMHTPETWKNLFLHASGHAVQFEVGLDNRPFPVGFSSSRLSVSQMKDLIDFIDEYASRHGITWKNEEAA